MTPDEMIDVITAHKMGKPIEYRYQKMPNIPWNIIPFPSFNFSEYNYRVKPEVKKRLIKLSELPTPCYVLNNRQDIISLVTGYYYKSEESISVNGISWTIAELNRNGFLYSNCKNGDWRSFEVLA